jgi:jumonji domain-containing protein 7
MPHTGEEVFVFPHEERVSFARFWEDLQGRAEDDYFSSFKKERDYCENNARGVPYCSFQNDSFRQEFAALHGDVPMDATDGLFAFFKEAFGNAPEAVNLWAGDGRSVSACHQDFFENIYCVVRGEKHFTLCPPTDVAFLAEQDYPTARFVPVPTTGTGGTDSSASACASASDTCGERSFAIRKDAGGCGSGANANGDGNGNSDNDDNGSDNDNGNGNGNGNGSGSGSGSGGTVPWISVDPLFPNLQRFPQAAHLSSVETCVQEGEVLYLPAMWYHRVGQSGPVVMAVNAWYDMAHGPAFVAAQLARSLAVGAPSPP